MNTQTHFPKGRASVEAVVIATLPKVRPAAPLPLTAAERVKLIECETKIHSRLESMSKCWREIVQRWETIRDHKLYREEFRTIEEYTQAKFGKSAARFYQLMRADGVIRDFGTFQSLESNVPSPKQITLPTSEAQVRALVPLPKEQRQAAWSEAVAAAGNGKTPTAKDVLAAVRRLIPSEPAATPDKVSPLDGCVKGRITREDHLADAKFRVVDAEIKLHSAVSSLKCAGDGLDQELYHADKAQYHLGCLKEALKNPKPISPLWPASAEAVARMEKIKERAGRIDGRP